MFIGHYSVSLAAKKIQPGAPLFVFLVGAQFLDYLFMILMPLGIEKMRMIPGFTASNNWDLYYMPYSHSLVAAIVWGIVFGGITGFIFRKRFHSSEALRLFMILAGITAFSHFVLDYIVHTPDLPLFSDSSLKVGLGLWNSRIGTIVAELIVFLPAAFFYIKSGKPGPGFAGRYGVWIFAGILTVMIILTPFAPQPHTQIEMAAQALFFYTVIAVAGSWLDKKRIYN